MDVLKIKKSKTKSLILCYSLIFIFPFFFGKMQLVTGPIVNFFLIYGALNLTKKEVLPVILMPSIFMVFGSLIFYKFFMFFIYLIPFIWLSNFSFVSIFRYFRKSYFITFALAIASKVSILCFSCLFLHKLNLVPSIAIWHMGGLQVITALLGGIFYHLLHLKTSRE